MNAKHRLSQNTNGFDVDGINIRSVFDFKIGNNITVVFIKSVHFYCPETIVKILIMISIVSSSC